MSYDVSLVIDTGDPEGLFSVWDANMTSNVACMWRHAGVDLKELHEHPASEVGPACTAAAKKIIDDPATYDEMAPANGWGSRKGCIRFLEKIAAACAKHPKTTFTVWC